MPALWQLNLGYAWNRLRSEGGYTWAGWRHERTGEGWQVIDANSKVVMVTEQEALAEMVAGLPELMEPDLRSRVLYVQDGNGSTKRAETAECIGIDAPQEAYDAGYADGWSHGAADMEKTLDEPMDGSMLGDNNEEADSTPYIGGEQ